ncbi:hypothetical protein DNTS_025971 [Danionella cerebrum]|uniref:Immunoglobulin I-set domain-containing protein n=1 Tax=Danionella cerebrum TaxID=2873325 RepID=A0A553PVG5_9TELE|nr:hypothetical protein DNTS_025971 [Danionella translucida]
MVKLFVLILFVIPSIKTGLRDQLFVKTGDSVQLDLQKTQQLPDSIRWKKDKSSTIVMCDKSETLIDSKYQNRVKCNLQNFSLTLENMQKADSGEYTARKDKEYFAEYKVCVLDAVEEAPNLTVSVSSSDSCERNITCSVQNLTLSSVYKNVTCATKIATSEKKNTLQLYCTDKSVTCNHSNAVSAKEARVDITDPCFNKQEKNFDPASIVSPVLALVIFTVVLWIYCRLNKGTNP